MVFKRILFVKDFRRIYLRAGRFGLALVILLLCISGAPFAPGGLTFLHLNEGSGTNAADLSGSSHAGTLVNGPTWTAGKFGQAVNFDGSNDYINIADHADYTLTATQNYTWSSWIKNNNFNDWGTVWSQSVDNNNYFYYYAHSTADDEAGPVTNGITIYWSNNGNNRLVVHSNDNVLPAGTWSYVTVTYQGSLAQASRFTIYVNGVDVTNRTDVVSTGSISTLNPTSIRIGGNQPFGDYLNGAVDEVRYYNRLLSLAEIQSDMNTPIDNTAPAVNISSPANGATVSSTTNVNANATDNVGVAGVQFMLDGVNLGAEDVVAPYSVSWNTTTASDGNHSLTARARDLAGNITTSAAVNVTVNNDMVAPTISITSPAAGMISQTVAVEATATDNIGITGVQFLLNGNNLGSEDVSAPYSFSWNTTGVTDGPYVLSARARDAAGNNTTATVNVIIHNVPDVQPPSVTVTSPASNAIVSQIINITASASDNLGISKVEFMVDGAIQGTILSSPYNINVNTTGFADGQHSLTARATDLDGNVTTSAAVLVIFHNNPDTQSPTVALTAPASGSVIAGTISITATASDNISMGGVQFRLNGINLGAEDTVPPYSLSWNSTTIPDGNYNITARARDASGNVALTSNLPVTVKNDAQPPSVSLTSPSAGVVSGTITVGANATDNVAVTGVQFLLNGSNLGAEDVTAPYSISLNTQTIANGTYIITARARDASGNTQTSPTVVVNVQNTPPDTQYPVVNITSPVAGNVGGIVNVTANATDNVGVVGVQFYLNGSALGAEDLAAPYTFPWNTYTVSNGNYTLIAIARDAAGNVTHSAAVVVNVNNVPDTDKPTVTFVSPSGGNASGNVTVKANATDNIAVAGVQFFLDGASLGPEDITAPYTVLWNSANGTAGSHTLSARSRDAAGNMSDVVFVSVNVIIHNPPLISNVSVSAITANSAMITWTTDVPSGSQVLYGNSASYGLSTLADATPVTSHTMILNGLSPASLHHYQVVSMDANGTSRSSNNTFSTAGLASNLGTLNQHTVLAYPAGKIIPWTSNPANGYDTVMFLAWKYMLSVVPNDPATGKPAYYSRSYINPNTQQMVDWPHNPAGLYAMLIESALKYYGYSGNAAVMQLANDIAIWHLDHGMTSPTDNWPGVPYASGDAGSLNYNGADVGNSNGQGDGEGVIQPDKIGELANAWLELYQFNGNIRFRDAAIQAANVLSAKIRTGTVNQSPWPFRVNGRTGVIREEYCSNIIPAISLLDNLIANGLGDTATYRITRNIAWNWMMTFPMVNNVWAQYFEDVGFQSSYNENLNQLNAMNVATYLLEHPEFDPAWETHVRGLITWVENNFGQTSLGSTIIREQQEFFFAMGSHTARYASVNAMLYEKTGDLAAKEKAYRSFNWATYMTRLNGVVIDGPEVLNQWFTDGYGDYIRHFMNGLAAVPEWVPANQTHLLRSTSIVKNVSYGINNVSYTTHDANAVEVIHLAFTPQSVMAGNVLLPQRHELSQPGWTLDVATKTIKVYHNNATNITISSGGPQPVCPGEPTYFVVPKPGADYTYQWQIDSTGGNFVNLSNGPLHSNVNSDTLRVSGAPTSFYGYRYRCIVTKNGVPLTGPVYELRFQVKWQGGASGEWEDGSNWSCNGVPDANTDVVIPVTSNNNPVIQNNTSVRSVTLSPGTTLSLSPGTVLNVKGK